MNKRTRKVTCIECGKTTLHYESKTSVFKYCSRQCQQNYTMKDKVINGNASTRTIKKYLLKNNGNKCWNCGITDWMGKPISLEMEHIDGDHQNNNLDNLSILCPNCHSQTPTYKAKNKGNGRFSRIQRYKEGKSY